MVNDPLRELKVYYLLKVKETIRKGNINFVNRDKNIKFLASKGFTIDDVKECILNLTPQDCISGPEKDYDVQRKESIFEFVKTYETVRIYIKMKIIIMENNDIVTIISFHD